MEFIKIDAYAKINLSLDVLHKREDNYHELSMIMQTIDLHDELRIQKIDEGIKLYVKGADLGENEKNLAYKAARLFLEEYHIKSGVEMELIKNIPMEAGLAGGSSDAAAVLKGLNLLFDTKVSTNELMDLGLRLGADVPYCILGGTYLAQGIGEKLTKLPDMGQLAILLIKPDFGISTKEVYTGLDLCNISPKERPDNELLIKALQAGDMHTLAANMKNVLETGIGGKREKIEAIKRRLVDGGAIGAMMSGSGSAVFGLFDDIQSLQDTYDAIVMDKTIGLEQIYITKIQNRI